MEIWIRALGNQINITANRDTVQQEFLKRKRKYKTFKILPTTCSRKIETTTKSDENLGRCLRHAQIGWRLKLVKLDLSVLIWIYRSSPTKQIWPNDTKKCTDYFWELDIKTFLISFILNLYLWRSNKIMEKNITLSVIPETCRVH